MSTAELKYFIISSITEIDDNTVLDKIKTYLKTIKQNSVTEKDTKKQLLKDLKEAVVELKLVEQGNLKSRPVQALLDEL